MTNPNADLDEDADVPVRAVQALNDATRKALEAGQPVVMVRDRQLIRIVGGVVEVLKELPPLKTATVRSHVAQQ